MKKYLSKSIYIKINFNMLYVCSVNKYHNMSVYFGGFPILRF